MRINFLNTVIAGVIAGILIGGSRIGSCCCWPVDLLVLFAAGAVAVYLSSAMISEQNDALGTGAVAGLLGGLIGGLLYAILAMAMQVLLGSFSLLGENDPGQSLPGLGASTLGSGIVSFACCLPTFLVLGAVLGAIGGLAAMALIRK